MYFANPNNVERFSLRIILLNKPDSNSFFHLRTANGKVFSTYQACAVEKGLLHDDKTWDETMNEASLTIIDSNKLRSLFSLILCFGHPSDPGKLWQKYILKNLLLIFFLK